MAVAVAQPSATTLGRSIGRPKLSEAISQPPSKIDDVLAHPKGRLGRIALSNRLCDVLVRLKHPVEGELNRFRSCEV
jgi:hypothetical protein